MWSGLSLIGRGLNQKAEVQERDGGKQYAVLKVSKNYDISIQRDMSFFAINRLFARRQSEDGTNLFIGSNLL